LAQIQYNVSVRDDMSICRL